MGSIFNGRVPTVLRAQRPAVSLEDVIAMPRSYTAIQSVTPSVSWLVEAARPLLPHARQLGWTFVFGTAESAVNAPLRPKPVRAHRV